METKRKVTLTPHPQNPRKITKAELSRLKDSLQMFGDLGGIVVNRATGHIISGHQRMNGQKLKPELTKLKKPTPTGTVASGFVTIQGDRHTYREVDWSQEKETAGMIAANRHRAAWDDPKLRTILTEIYDQGGDFGTIGFLSKEVEKLMRQGMTLELEGGKSDELPPMEETELAGDRDKIRMVQLFLGQKAHNEFHTALKRLQKSYRTENQTETIMKAVERQYKALTA